MLRRFVKKEVLKDISSLQLVRLDVSDKQSWVNLKEVNTGLGAESLLKVFFHIYNCNFDGFN